MGLYFTDADSNPMAAGVKVSVYPASAPQQNAANLVATDWTQAGGYCPNIVVSDSVNYVAVFIGRQGPTNVQAFTGGAGTDTTVQCSSYSSPALTAMNWAYFLTLRLLPKGPAWWGDDARQLGAVAWAMAYAFGAALENLGDTAQEFIQAIRVQSSAGSDVDTWAYDFLGQWLPRFTGETDASFKSRIYIALQAPKTTLDCIYAMVVAYYIAVSMSTVGTLAFDESGGGAFDGIGAFDLIADSIPMPTIAVWDRQSRPDLANEFHINPNNNDYSFVIQLGFTNINEGAWYLDYGSLDYDSFLLDINNWDASETPPDPRLGALVNFVKAAASKPIYLTTVLST
jgi:hypothetical protein